MLQLSLCWKKVQRKKGNLPKASNTLKMCSFFPRLDLHRKIQGKEKHLDGKAWRKLSQVFFHSTMSACNGKSQQRFYNDTEKMNSPLHHLKAWIFIRPHRLDFPGKCPSEGHRVIKQRKTQELPPPSLRYEPQELSGDLLTALQAPTLLSSWQVSHTGLPHLIIKALCAPALSAKGFVLTAKAEAGVLVVLQLFHALLQLCPAMVICEKNWRAAQLFHKCFPPRFEDS